MFGMPSRKGVSGWEREEALIDYAKYTSGYDVSHILAAYSVSIGQSAAKKDDMLSKLGAVSEKMFPVTSVEKSEETEAPASYTVYEPVILTVVTGKEQTGTIDGIPQYRYETGEQTYYRPGGTRISGTTIEIDAYKQEEVTTPVYGDDGSIIGTEKETYYKANGKETVSPSKETIKYVECTIHPFDNAVVTEAFGIDPDAAYGESGLMGWTAAASRTGPIKQPLAQAFPREPRASGTAPMRFRRTSFCRETWAFGWETTGDTTMS